MFIDFQLLEPVSQDSNGSASLDGLFEEALRSIQAPLLHTGADHLAPPFDIDSKRLPTQV